MPDLTVILGLAAIVALVAANGLFVATEFAYVAVRRTRIEHLASRGNARARLLQIALRHLDKYIAATQLGITMSSLALGWVGEPALAHLLEPPLESAVGEWAGTAVAHTVAVIITFVIITAMHIVLGELAPKTMALQRSEATALWVAAPIEIFTRIFRPFIWLLNGLGFAVVRLFGVQPVREEEASLGPEELELVMEASERAGLLSTAELLLARRGLEFGEIQADQIMVPRTEVVAIPSDASLEEVRQTVIAHPHRRYPVYDDDLDHVVGILDAKDLMRLEADGGDWSSYVGPAVAIPESVSVEVAVTELRAQGARLAVVIDEHGGTSGILTGDDVLARLLGQWRPSERRGSSERVRALASGNLLLDGLALVADVESVAGIEIAGEDFDTIGGFVMARLGRIPHAGDRVTEAGYEFRVLAMDGRRVSRVLALRAARVAAS